tara:strand:- start:812 stop:1498 length:687 start_codon:yes stop_codon:yes gene_type:complete
MWFDIVKNYEDIPNDYIQEGIQSFVDSELGDKIFGRRESTLEFFWEEFDEVTRGNIDVKFTPEMVMGMEKFWKVIITRVGQYLGKEYNMWGWFNENNNALLRKKVSEGVADWLNNLDRQGPLKRAAREKAKQLVIETANKLDYVTIEGDWIKIEPEWAILESTSFVFNMQDIHDEVCIAKIVDYPGYRIEEYTLCLSQNKSFTAPTADSYVTAMLMAGNREDWKGMWG